MIRLRLSPTPSLPLTVAALRVALANDVFRRGRAATLLLRLDDLDEEQCRPGIAEQIEQDLRWCGIGWEATLRQSERRGLYQGTIERLRRDGFLYPCFESEEELRAKQEFRRRRRQPLIYDRAMLSLTAAQRAAAEAKGKRPYWRFKLSGRRLAWTDLILGERRADLSAVSDPVLVGADGTPASLLAGVLGDLDQGITHVIQADDGAANGAIRLELLDVLAGPRHGVRFAHLPAPVDEENAPGFRRLGSLPVRGLRQDGVEPEALLAGLSGRDAASVRLADFADPRLSVRRMLQANRAALGRIEFPAVADRLPKGATEAFWRAIRGQIDLLREARGWWEVVAGTIVPPVIEGAQPVLAAAASLLPAEPWDHDVWHGWVASIQETTALGAEAVEAALRLALTGEEDGPDLADLLPLIGRSRVASRLAVAAA